MKFIENTEYFVIVKDLYCWSEELVSNFDYGLQFSAFKKMITAHGALIILKQGT